MISLLTRWSEALGRTGIAGAALIALAGAYYFGSVAPAEGRRDALRADLARFEQPVSASGDSAQIPPELLREQLDTFTALLAEERAIGDQLARIDEIARHNDVVLRRGSYRFALDGAGRIGRYEIGYSAEAAYFRARIFLREALRQLPMLALREFQFQRRDTRTGRGEFSARVVVLVRRGEAS